MTDVTVEVEESPQVEATPPVVIVDAPSDSVPSWAVELIERVTRMEAAVSEAMTTAWTAHSVANEAQYSADAAADIASIAVESADTALDVANEAAEVAVAVSEVTDTAPEVAEMTSGDLIPDVVPRKTHPLFRSLQEWKNDIAS